MIATCVFVYVKPEFVDDFIKASVANHTESVKEAGNLRFDVLQCSDDPTRFCLYEAYESDDAAALHKGTAHYNTWRETVAPMMAKPREAIKHNIIAPKDKAQW